MPEPINCLNVSQAGGKDDHDKGQLVTFRVLQNRADANFAISKWHRSKGYRTRVLERSLSGDGVKVKVFVALAWRLPVKAEDGPPELAKLLRLP